MDYGERTGNAFQMRVEKCLINIKKQCPRLRALCKRKIGTNVTYYPGVFSVNKKPNIPIEDKGDSNEVCLKSVADNVVDQHIRKVSYAEFYGLLFFGSKHVP